MLLLLLSPLRAGCFLLARLLSTCPVIFCLRGCAWLATLLNPGLGGCVLGTGLVLNNYKTTLPIKKGLSSSAAVCVLTARAFNRLYVARTFLQPFLTKKARQHQRDIKPASLPTEQHSHIPTQSCPTSRVSTVRLVALAVATLVVTTLVVALLPALLPALRCGRYNLKLSTRGEMEFAYQGEILTPSKCGRMDQACAFGCRFVLNQAPPPAPPLLRPDSLSAAAAVYDAVPFR